MIFSQPFKHLQKEKIDPRREGLRQEEDNDIRADTLTVKKRSREWGMRAVADNDNAHDIRTSRLTGVYGCNRTFLAVSVTRYTSDWAVTSPMSCFQLFILLALSCMCSIAQELDFVTPYPPPNRLRERFFERNGAGQLNFLVDQTASHI